MAIPVIREEKRSLRDRLVAARLAIPDDRRPGLAARAIARLLALPEIEAAPTVMAFVSFKGELPTETLLAALLEGGKRVLVPRITPAGLLPVELRGLSELVPGNHGIPTCEGPAFEGAIEAIVVPGAGFTARGDRLGHGKAYYDRFLATQPAAFTCGLCWDEQVVAEIPMESHDRRVAAVCTPERLYRP